MDEPPHVAFGTAELRGLLDRESRDLRELDLVGFRRWLLLHLERWKGDPVFAQQVAIRELRRAHPEVRELERARDRAAEADRLSPTHARLQEVERAVADTEKAVNGLTAALSDASADRRGALARKLHHFQARGRMLREEHDALVAASPARRELWRLTQELGRLRSALGLDREEARLTELAREQGRRSGSAGHGFERRAEEVARRLILPRTGHTADGQRILRGVTLGAARTEIDLLVVTAPVPGEPVRVLAMVESKRNPNDLAHGFLQRQDNLAWLSAERGAYDADRYRTRYFPTGHLDRPVEHVQDGERYTLAAASFGAFGRDPTAGVYLDRLWLITRPGPLWGLSTAALGRVRHRVATDAGWAPDDDAYLDALLAWCRTLAGPVEAPDVVRMYAAAHGDQLLLVDR